MNKELQNLIQTQQAEVRDKLAKHTDKLRGLRPTLDHCDLIENLDHLTATNITAGYKLALEEVEKVQYGTDGKGNKWVMLEDLEAHITSLKEQLEGNLG